MYFFMFMLSICLKLCTALNDYDDYFIEKYRIQPLRKRDLILKSSICEYFNFLPICSETIVYRPKRKRKINFNNFGLSYQLHNYLYNKNSRQKWNNPEFEQKNICHCRSPYFQRRHSLHQLPKHCYHMHNCNAFWKHNLNNKIKKRKNKFRNPRLYENDEYDSEICKDFLKQINDHLEKVYNNNTVIQWNYESNMTDLNKELAIAADAIFARELQKNFKKLHEFDQIYNCSNISGIISRQFNFLTKLGNNALPVKDYLELQTLSLDMETLFSVAKIKDYKNKNKCLHLEPDITHLMANSRDCNELEYIWEAWRNETGKKIKDLYPQYVNLLNKAAQLNGYSNAAELWLSVYDFENIEKTILRTWNEIRPLYLELHAYVRYKLQTTYNETKFNDGLIPAHLLGNIFGQTWINLYNITAPYPEFNLPDITAQLQTKQYSPKMMFLEAENFFKSINLSEMTEDFWKKSIIEQRTDVEMVCHASAWNMYNKTDFRIKMCTHITYEDFIVIHHEMGHIQYYMAYKDLPLVFREGANPGFHEAIGDTIALSVSTPKHLITLGLLDDDNEENKYEKEINYLFLMALQKIAFLPYALVVDLWRWDVFREIIDKENYNTHWWKLKKEYQGIQPPKIRPEMYFDPCAKYHIAAGVPYIRYFISFVIQFQFHEALCRKAGKLENRNPLHTCDIYMSTEAGNLLKKMLSLGQSKSWPEAMHVLTNNCNIHSKSILLYFEPLENWLKMQNKKLNLNIGWK